MRVQAERRRHPRVAFAGKRVVVLPDASPGGPGVVCELHDVSVGGLRCATASALHVDGGEVVVEFAVPAPWRPRVLRLPARAVRTGPQPWMYAFELTPATGSSEAKRLEAFVRRASAASRRVLEERRAIDRQVEEALAMVQLGLPRPDGPRPRVVMLTSPTPGATGFLAAGLAVVLAGQGDSVLAADLDLGDPKLHRLLGAGIGPGVTDWLRSGATDRELLGLTQSGAGGVRVLSAGEADPQRVSCGRPAIASIVDALRHTDAQYVLINAPACLVAADAGLLSEMADDVLLVLRSEGSSEAEVVQAGALLERHGAHVRGVILTEYPAAPGGSQGWSSFLRHVKELSFGRRGARRSEDRSTGSSAITRQVGFADAVPAGKLRGKDRR